MRWVLLSGSSLLLLLAAAKAHGRELRLERVALGFEHAVFGGQNPPPVEALWQAERLRFWVLTPVLSLALLTALRARGAGAGLAALGALAWAPSVMFAALGVASLARAGVGREGLAGSVAWWSVVVVAGAVTLVCGLRSA